MSAIRGYPSQQKLDRTQIQFVTVEPVHKEQNGASVVAHQFVYQVGLDIAEAGSTVGKIVATAHLSLEGDVIRFTSGSQSGKEIKVVSVTTDEIILAEDLPAAISAGTTFQILRHKYPVVEETGEVKVTGTFSFTESALAAGGDPLPAEVKVAGGYDGALVRPIKTDANGELQVDVLSSALPSGAATSAAQTDGTQKSQIVDAAGDVADVKLLSVNLAGTDKGLVTNTIIHGETTGGGGGYVDVKVTPSGALTTESTLAGIDASILGQDTMANSLPVVIASNQSAIPISGSITVSDAANGAVGAAAPTTANLSGGSDGSILRALKTDANGELQIDVLSSALPSGAATSDNQTNGNQRVRLAADGANNVIAGLISGALSAATDRAITTRGTIYGVPLSGGDPVILRTTDSGGRLSVDINAMPAGSATEATLSTRASEATLSALNGKVTACNTGAVTVSSSVLPTGAATETTLASIDTKTPALGQALMAASTPVVIASNQTAIPVTGSFTAGKLSVVDLLDANILDTSSTNIPGSASSPVQVIASTAAEIKAIQLLDTTGAFVGVYVGGVGSEVLKFVMGPGSDQTIEHNIPAASRVSLKRLDSTAAVSSGIVAFNCMG